MQPVAVEKNFFTTREAADMLGVAVSTIQLWVESGILQAWRTTGGHRRVLRASVEAMLHKGPTPQRGVTERRVAAPSAQRRLRVMIVDDDAILLRLYRAKLAQWPMAPEVVALDNAVTALLTIGLLATLTFVFGWLFGVRSRLSGLGKLGAGRAAKAGKTAVISDRP